MSLGAQGDGVEDVVVAHGTVQPRGRPDGEGGTDGRAHPIRLVVCLRYAAGRQAYRRQTTSHGSRFRLGYGPVGERDEGDPARIP